MRCIYCAHTSAFITIKLTELYVFASNRCMRWGVSMPRLCHLFLYGRDKVSKMNYFEYFDDYRVLECKTCLYAVLPIALAEHLRTRHRHLNVEFRNIFGTRAIQIDLRKKFDLVDPSTTPVFASNEKLTALPLIPVKRVLRCNKCSYVACTESVIVSYYSKNHAGMRGSRGEKRIKGQP